MKRTLAQLRADARAIWDAAVAAVDSAKLVRDSISIADGMLIIGDESIALDELRRIVVVGCGKAGAGMAAGVEEALETVLTSKQVTGWLNVPADCVRQLRKIHLHAARPAGLNEPTAEGVAGSVEILKLVESLGPNDLCICLISGGGSALLPAPVDGISLADKQAITRHLSGAGANIAELNTVRKQLSRIKGGGLARACRAGRLVTLVISDVLGDPLDVIASGPTVVDSATARDALAVLEKFRAREAGISASVFELLQRKIDVTPGPITTQVTNLVIGNNAVAVDAAGQMAERLGYSHAMDAATKLEGSAEEVGRHLARMASQMCDQPGPDCLITGGEPIVTLAPRELRGRGGRNQQLVLAALIDLLPTEITDRVVILSGGTDGEDGPTDAAGAFVDADVIARMRQLQLDPLDYLRRNDAYTFFEQTGSLIKTGPTHTNVCDVRVMVIGT
jgi:hydroxypyruvate reductase